LSSLRESFDAIGGWTAIGELAERMTWTADALDGPLPLRLHAAAAHLRAVGFDIRATGGNVPAPSTPGGLVPMRY
jgi:hypothetical protein